MTRFFIDSTQSEDFSLPEGDPVGQLTGGNTRHTHFVKMSRGNWTYTITAQSAKRSGRGML